jgi:hypothetical protein
MSSTSTPRRVSIFISRAMTVCSSARSSSSVGAPGAAHWLAQYLTLELSAGLCVG